MGLLLVLSPAIGPQLSAHANVLLVSLAAVAANLFWLEGATTKVMKERAALEKMSTPVATTFYPEGKSQEGRGHHTSFIRSPRGVVFYMALD